VGTSQLCCFWREQTPLISKLVYICFSFSPALFLSVFPCVLLFFALSLFVCFCPALFLSSSCLSVLISSSPSLFLSFSLSLFQSVSLCPFHHFSVFLCFCRSLGLFLSCSLFPLGLSFSLSLLVFVCFSVALFRSWSLGLFLLYSLPILSSFSLCLLFSFSLCLFLSFSRSVLVSWSCFLLPSFSLSHSLLLLVFILLCFSNLFFYLSLVVSVSLPLFVSFLSSLYLFWSPGLVFSCPPSLGLLLSSSSCLFGSFSLISASICLLLSLYHFLSVSLSCLVSICVGLLVLFSLTLLLFVSFSPPLLFCPALFLYSLLLSCLVVSVSLSLCVSLLSFLYLFWSPGRVFSYHPSFCLLLSSSSFLSYSRSVISPSIFLSLSLYRVLSWSLSCLLYICFGLLVLPVFSLALLLFFQWQNIHFFENEFSTTEKLGWVNYYDQNGYFEFVQPIPLGMLFPKAQSSNVSFATFWWKEVFELWAWSFRKCHPKWDWLYHNTSKIPPARSCLVARFSNRRVSSRFHCGVWKRNNAFQIFPRCRCHWKKHTKY